MKSLKLLGDGKPYTRKEVEYFPMSPVLVKGILPVSCYVMASSRIPAHKIKMAAFLTDRSLERIQANIHTKALFSITPALFFSTDIVQYLK